MSILEELRDNISDSGGRYSLHVGGQSLESLWDAAQSADELIKQDKANIRAYREALVLIRDKANKGASAVCASIADRALDEHQ